MGASRISFAFTKLYSSGGIQSCCVRSAKPVWKAILEVSLGLLGGDRRNVLNQSPEMPRDGWAKQGAQHGISHMHPDPFPPSLSHTGFSMSPCDLGKGAKRKANSGEPQGALPSILNAAATDHFRKLSSPAAFYSHKPDVKAGLVPLGFALSAQTRILFDAVDGLLRFSQETCEVNDDSGRGESASGPASDDSCTNNLADHVFFRVMHKAPATQTLANEAFKAEQHPKMSTPSFSSAREGCARRCVPTYVLMGHSLRGESMFGQEEKAGTVTGSYRASKKLVWEPMQRGIVAFDVLMDSGPGLGLGQKTLSRSSMILEMEIAFERAEGEK